MLERVPMGRPGTAQEVAALVRFLSGNDSGYITGQVFIIDGGLTT
jgi:NAD(P)-dependent dehydrogenase (short-subunit alcohol dehydrogenase family)